nr:hypothetical protein P5630_11640 [Bacillus subtilis]
MEQDIFNAFFHTYWWYQWGYADWRYNEYGFVELRGEVKGTTYTGDLEIGKIPTPDKNGAWICSNGTKWFACASDWGR